MSSIFSEKVKERQQDLSAEEIPFSAIAQSSYFRQYLQGFLTSLTSDLDLPMIVKIVYQPIARRTSSMQGAGVARIEEKKQNDWASLAQPASAAGNGSGCASCGGCGNEEESRLPAALRKQETIHADSTEEMLDDGEERIRLSRLNGKEIVINAAHPLITSYETLENKMFCILGLLFHETGHLMFMDLKGENACIQEVLEGRLPFEEEFLAEHLVSKFFLRAVRFDLFRPLFAKIYHDLASVISDHHDEERICQTGGVLLRKGIQTLREAQYATVRSLDEMEADESCGPFATVLAMVYQYLRYGSIFVIDEETKASRSRLGFMKRIKPDLDAALAADSVKEKYLCINNIVLKMWPLMHLEPPEHGSESGMVSQESDTEFSYEYDEENAVFEGDGDGERQELEKKEDENAEEQEGSGSKAHDTEEYDEDGSRSGSGSDETMEEAVEEDAVAQIAQGMDEAGGMSFSEQPSFIPEGSPSGHSGAGSMTTAAEADISGGSDPVEMIEPGIRKIKESMIEDMAEEQVAQEAVNGSLIMINNGNAFTSHKGILPNLVKAKPTEEDRIEYETVAKEYMSFIRKTEREIRKIMQEETIAKQRRRIMGREIDTRNLYKLDQRYFMKKKNPEKQLDMAIAILVDNSGSMRGERLESAKEAAILLNEVLERLEIPFMIAGHNCQDVPQICFYKMFEDHRSAKYSVNRMQPAGDNRDGLAIDVVSRFLLERDEKDKLFLIISDGQPNASGYTGEPARQDIRQIVRRLRAEEVKTIAFAIGDDKPQIRSIYGESFVDITDHDQFPKRLSKMIEKEIVARL